MIRRSASVSRKALGLFVVVALLAFAQLAWWIIFQVEQAAHGREEALSRARAECEAAAGQVRLTLLEWGGEVAARLPAIGGADRESLPAAGWGDVDTLRRYARGSLEDGLFEAVWLESGRQVQPLAGPPPAAPGPFPLHGKIVDLRLLDGRPAVGVKAAGHAPVSHGVVLVAVSSLQHVAESVAGRFPHVVAVASSVRESTGISGEEATREVSAAEVMPGLSFRVSPSYELVLQQTFRRPLVMFATEGTFFCLVMLAGVFVIVATLRQEVALKHQQANFVSAVSHELKSPLASLRLHLQTMQMRDLPDQRRQTYLVHMEEDIARLEMLTRNLLAAARLEGRRPSMPLEPRDLAADVRRFLEEARPSLEHRNVSLEVEIEAGVPVRVNPDGLRSVLHNLMDNAVKYSGPRPELRIVVRRAAQEAILEVRDRGIGVMRSDRHRVFEPFYRVGDEMVREREGTGLGLYVVREVIKAHHGVVEVESEGNGKGSIFRVRLPLADTDQGTDSGSGREGQA